MYNLKSRISGRVSASQSTTSTCKSHHKFFFEVALLLMSLMEDMQQRYGFHGGPEFDLKIGGRVGQHSTIPPRTLITDSLFPSNAVHIVIPG
jgi:hypothetical protein